MTIDTLLAFLGWATLLNFVLLGVTGAVILLARDRLERVHGTMFDMAPAEVSAAYFRWLAMYKLLTLVFFLIPYLALRIAV